MNPTITFFSFSLPFQSDGEVLIESRRIIPVAARAEGWMTRGNFFSWGLEVGDSPNTRPSPAKDGQCDNPCTIGDSFTSEIAPNVGEREKGGKGSYRQKGSKQKRERRARTVEFIPQLINQGPGNALRAFRAMQKPSTVKAYVTAMDRGNRSQQKAVFYLERGLKELFTFSWSQPVYHPLMTYIVRLYTDITMETSVIVYLSQAFEPQHF